MTTNELEKQLIELIKDMSESEMIDLLEKLDPGNSLLEKIYNEEQCELDAMEKDFKESRGI